MFDIFKAAHFAGPNTTWKQACRMGWFSIAININGDFFKFIFKISMIADGIPLGLKRFNELI